MAKKKVEVKKNAMVAAPNNALANPASIFAADAGAGMETAGIESFAIPFLMMLQKGSPQVDEASGATIPGAKAGMLYENISQNLVDGKEGLVIIPCAYRRVYLQWSQSKGFQGEILPEEVNRRLQVGEIKEVKGKYYVPNKDGEVDVEEADTVVDVRNHYVLVLDRKTADWRKALITLRSTQIKKSRALMTALASVKVEVNGKMIQPPTFANLVHVSAVPESNDKGTWFGWNFKLDGFVQRADLYAAAKQFHAEVVKGVVEHNYAEVEATDEQPKGF